MAITMRRDSKIREEMQRHRAATPLKRPVHPGLTRTEAGYSASELERLAAGVCHALADQTDRGTRWAHRLVLGCGLVVLAAAVATALGWW